MLNVKREDETSAEASEFYSDVAAAADPFLLLLKL